MTTENITEHTIRPTNSCYFTMVAIDEERHPVPVPRLECVTDEERRRWAEAQERRRRARTR